MIISPPIRGQDDYGSGVFGAPRGDRTHKGVDIACYPGSKAHALCYGRVTKVGYPYQDDLSYRYVEVTDSHGRRFRHFYVEPSVKIGDEMIKGDVLRTVQDLSKRYPRDEKHPFGITNHMHFEIKHGEVYLNPLRFVSLP